MLSSSYDRGVNASTGSNVLLAKSDGYWVPGVEIKLSAKLSAGEFSNLICGVVDIVNEFGAAWLVPCDGGMQPRVVEEWRDVGFVLSTCRRGDSP